eukprot:jgi/Tetstr1/449997/TSEL_037049.t1
MAASSTAQPPGVVKTLTDDKKRKRPVKKRRGKKLTVAESEAESEAQAEAEAEAEAEAARSSKRRVPRARKNKNKQLLGNILILGHAQESGEAIAARHPFWSPSTMTLAAPMTSCSLAAAPRASLPGFRGLRPASARAVIGVPTPGRHARATSSLLVQAAKKGAKKGGKKGGGKKKGPGSLMDMVKPKEPFEDVNVIMQNLLMVESFRRNVGRPLMENVEINSAAKELYLAPFVMITCDRGLSADPKIVYVNAAGLELLGKTWEEVVDTPASDILALDELSDAQEQGVLEGYAGPWSAGEEGDDEVDAAPVARGKIMGQGIVFSMWTQPDGSTGGVGISNAPPPTPEEIEAAEGAVTEQGQAVRALKESGLTNQDAEVAEAVEELLRRKTALAELKQRAEEEAAAAQG